MYGSVVPSEPARTHCPSSCFAQTHILIDAQVTLQTLVLVSIFQQHSRARVIAGIERALPARIPWLWDRLGYQESPAQLFHSLVLQKVAAFKASVAVRQARAARGPR